MYRIAGMETLERIQFILKAMKCFGIAFALVVQAKRPIYRAF